MPGPNPASLVAALKTQPIAQDQFNGSDFPGSYLWQRGGVDPEQFHAMKAAKATMPKMPKMGIASVHPALTVHIPAGGIKFNGR